MLPVLTEAAQHFVGAVTFSALASEPVASSLWQASDPIPHTRLGQRADAVLVCPATADLLARYAHGLADDLLAATLLATRAPVVVAPAMHAEMLEHPAVVANLALLASRGVGVVPAGTGRLAGGDVGSGRLAEPADIVAAVAGLFRPRDLAGKRVVVSAGGTREPLDPVRFLGNRSSGRQGHALAEAAAARGAAVTLVTSSSLPPPPGIDAVVRFTTAAELEAALLETVVDADVVVMAAAVADFRPRTVAAEKLHRADGLVSLELEPTPDILAALAGKRRAGQLFVGFAAETAAAVARAQEKLAAKGVDLVVANDVTEEGAGFEVETNHVVIVSRAGVVAEVGPAPKRVVADAVLDVISAHLAT